MYYYYFLPSEMEASSYRSPKTCFASVLLLSVLYCLILGWLARVWRRRQDSQAMVLPKPGMQSNLYRFRLNCNNCLSTYFNQHNIKSLKIENITFKLHLKKIGYLLPNKYTYRISKIVLSFPIFWNNTRILFSGFSRYVSGCSISRYGDLLATVSSRQLRVFRLKGPSTGTFPPSYKIEWGKGNVPNG